jgi:hypothetical protein
MRSVGSCKPVTCGSDPLSRQVIGLARNSHTCLLRPTAVALRGSLPLETCNRRGAFVPQAMQTGGQSHTAPQGLVFGTISNTCPHFSFASPPASFVFGAPPKRRRENGDATGAGDVTCAASTADEVAAGVSTNGARPGG